MRNTASISREYANCECGNKCFSSLAVVYYGLVSTPLAKLSDNFCTVTESWDGVWKQLGKSAKVLEGICMDLKVWGKYKSQR